MEYVIFDLEWNQARYCNLEVRKVLNKFPFRLHGEIIQIGAVKLADNGEIIDDFKIGIKPKFFSSIDKNIQSLTGIDQETLAQGDNFPDAIMKFTGWSGEDAVFFSWGQDDIDILDKNLIVYGLESLEFDKFFDLQKIFSLQAGDSMIQQAALSRAVEYFSIQSDLMAHDALNDAYYAAYVAQKLDLKSGIAECVVIRDNTVDIFEDSACIKLTNIYRLKEKATAFQHKKIMLNHCPTCMTLMQNRKMVKLGRNEYILLSRCKVHDTFLVKINFEKDYCFTITARKRIYQANQSMIDLYNKKFKQKVRKNLSDGQVTADLNLLTSDNL